MSEEEKEKDNLPIAARNNNLARIKELLAAGYNIDWHLKRKSNALWEACEAGNFELVKFLVENGADINIDIYDISDYGLGALRYASMADHYNIMKYLLEKGADPDSPDLDTGHTILMDRLQNYKEKLKKDKEIKIIKLLIEFKADLNARCSNPGYGCGCPTIIGNDIKQLAKKTECKEIIELINGIK